MRILPYLIITILLINTSCKSKNITNTTRSVVFTELYTDTHSNVKERNFLVIKEKNKLTSIFTKINSTRMPGINLPKIDFNKEMVIGLFMGSKPNGGYAIKIDHIEQTSNELIIYYSEQHPSGMATSVMTQPCFLAKIVKIDMPLRFELASK